MMWCGILKTFYALKIKIYNDNFREKNVQYFYEQRNLISALKV